MPCFPQHRYTLSVPSPNTMLVVTKPHIPAPVSLLCSWKTTYQCGVPRTSWGLRSRWGALCIKKDYCLWGPNCGTLYIFSGCLSFCLNFYSGVIKLVLLYIWGLDSLHFVFNLVLTSQVNSHNYSMANSHNFSVSEFFSVKWRHSTYLLGSM